jgi:tetratricopeptide (TPR) repeat protein
LTLKLFGGVLLVAPLAEAGEPLWRSGKAPVSNAARACTSDESWVFSSQVSPPFRKRFLSSRPGKGGAIDSLVAGFALKYENRSPRPEVRALGEYLIYRGFLDLGVVHLAHRGMTSILLGNTDPATLGVRLAAFDCLGRIRAQHASMELPKGSAQALAGLRPEWLAPEQREALAEGMFAMAAWKISEKGKKADVRAEHAFLVREPFYRLLLVGNQYAIRGENTRAIAALEGFLKRSPLPAQLEAHRDAVQLNLARLYFQAGQHDRAVAAFQAVKNRSNWVSQALNDLAWNQLSRGDYTAATSAAFNLMLGELKDTFNPAAPVIAAISYFENCQYDDARRAVDLFKQRYGRNYQWLYTWYQRHSKQPISLYPLLAKYVEKKKGVPRAIASEWLRSPVFISQQQEVNLTLDEREKIPELLAALEAHPAYDRRKPRSALVTFRAWLTGFAQELPRIEATLLARINREITFRNRFMIAQFVEALENVQLLEIELDSARGERMLAKAGDPDREERLAAAKKKAEEERAQLGPVLDWGRAPAGEWGGEEEEDVETWEDEVGAIRTEVLNLCRGAKK